MHFQFWPHTLITLFTLIGMFCASLHILLFKRDTHSASAWILLVWFSPLVGMILYFILGINRIRRKAKRKRGDRVQWQKTKESLHKVKTSSPQHISQNLVRLSNLVESITAKDLLPGNEITPFTEVEAVYEEMLKTIKSAKTSIHLCTYIFDYKDIGQRFIEALSAAQSRGVAVRILIDAVGAKYSVPSIVPHLHKEHLKVELFMPSLYPWRFRFLNLRNHRKILVIDGECGFTGGMNMRSETHPITDLHFKIRGPVVRNLQETFCDDWYFTTGEKLKGDLYFPPPSEQGKVFARGIADGPDEDFEHFRWVIMGALASAEESICILTPYFLPDPTLISMLSLASLRGIEVTVIVPENCNIRVVSWASMPNMWQLLEHGVRVFQSHPNFDHTKLMIVDKKWVLLGSANWDPRSISLNFEFNVESYDEDFAKKLFALVQDKISNSQELDLNMLRKQPLWVQTRNKLFHLFSPYL